MMGQIKPMPRSLQPSKVQHLSQRVANAAFPATAEPIFTKLRTLQLAKFGGYGMAHDPDKLAAMQMTQTPSMPPQAFDTIKSQMRFAQPVAQSGIPSRDNPRIASQGVASVSATGMAALDPHGDSDGHTMGEVGFQHASGGPMDAGTGPDGKASISDQKWPVTLSQIMGQRILTEQQLQAASIQNVRGLFNPTGMNQQETDEIAYYLQRFIIEGYVRGVDVAAHLRGTKPTVGLVGGGNPGYDGIAYHPHADGVRFWRGQWDNNSDARKMEDFYHEFGHLMLDRGHTGYGTDHIMNDAGYTPGLMDNAQHYNRLMDELYGHTTLAGGNGADVTAVMKQHPEWFPSLTGADIPAGGGGGGTAPGAGGSPDTNNVTNINTPPSVTAIQPTMTMSSLMSHGINKNETPPDAARTPTAGVLYGGGVNPFAAGIAALAQPGGANADLGGALAKLKSG